MCIDIYAERIRMVGHTTINVTYMFHSKLFAILEISEHTSISSTAQNICFLWQTVWRTDHCAQCKSGISCERLNDIEVCVCVCVCVPSKESLFAQLASATHQLP